MKAPVLDVLKRGVSPETMVIEDAEARRVGEVAQQEIQRSVIYLPVVDSGFLHEHMRYELK